MFSVGDLGFAAILIGVAAVLVVAFMTEDRAWAEIAERRFVPADADRLRGPIRQLLESVPNGEVIDTGHGSCALTVRRRPLWMVFFILFSLPFGLLLLSMKNVGVVLVTVVPVDGGTEVLVLGRTTAKALRLLDGALAPREVSVR